MLELRENKNKMDNYFYEQRVVFQEAPESAKGGVESISEKTDHETTLPDELVYALGLQGSIKLPDDIAKPVLSDWKRLQGIAVTQPDMAKAQRDEILQKIKDYLHEKTAITGLKLDEYGEKHLSSFLDALAPAERDQQFSGWLSKQTDSKKMHSAQVSVLENRQDNNEKHKRLANEYLVVDEKRINGHVTFSVDFNGNQTAEWGVGAANLIPPTVKTVNIYDENGSILFKGAERGVRGGRIGYFVSHPENEYAYVHSGYRIEVTEIQSEQDAEVQARIAEEREIFEKDGQQMVVKDALQKFFDGKDLKVVVDDYYFGVNYQKISDGFPENWWDNYLSGEFTEDDFNEFFEQQFSEEDINLLTNLSSLYDRQIYMGDFEELSGNSKFDKLKGKVLSKEEISEFKATELEGKDLEDYLFASLEVAPDEPFVESSDDFGNRVKLRQSAMRSFEKAKRLAKTADPPVMLRVFSSFRSEGHQAKIYEQALRKYGSAGEARKWAAPPGNSAHQTGGAIDIVAVVNGAGGDKHPNQKYLWNILPQAGFVNYDREAWHWEIYTDRWAKNSPHGNPAKVYLPA
ncbi:MAG: M15 family metallopeptidase [Patescibacteria group bacterium]